MHDLKFNQYITLTAESKTEERRDFFSKITTYIIDQSFDLGWYTIDKLQMGFYRFINVNVIYQMFW